MKLLLAVTLFCLLYSCKEKKQKEEGDHFNSNEYYQKETPYDGWRGEIDSIVSFTFATNITDNDILKGALKTKNTKVFNQNGYLVSFLSLTYKSSEFLSASQVLYTRDENNLQSGYATNMMAKSGEGYTLKYTLRSRDQNKEIWELVRKLAGRNIELTAEIREYAKEGMKIFVQVENTDSVTLVSESKYKNEKLKEIIFYENENLQSKTELNYNKDNFIIESITERASEISKQADVKRFEYKYDFMKNPIEVSIYEGDILMEILENKIYYRKND